MSHWNQLDVQYRGVRHPWGCVIDIRYPDEFKWRSLPASRSQAVWNHSPSGFEWGYGGSGPAQTALALLLDFTDDRELAVEFHQKFKFEVVVKLEAHWVLPGHELAEWLRRQGVMGPRKAERVRR